MSLLHRRQRTAVAAPNPVPEPLVRKWGEAIVPIEQLYAIAGRPIYNRLIHLDLSHVPTPEYPVPRSAQKLSLTMRSITSGILPHIRHTVPEAQLLELGAMAQAQEEFYRLKVTGASDAVDQVQRQANDTVNATLLGSNRYPELNLALHVQALAEADTPQHWEISRMTDEYFAVCGLALQRTATGIKYM